MDTKGKRGPRAIAPADAPAEAAAPAAEPAEPEAPAAAEIVAVAATPPLAHPEPTTHAAREPDVFAALAEAQAVLARGLEALSSEMAGLARSEIDAAARSATEMLGAKTFLDAVEVNAGFARSSLDSWVESSARLSELGVKLAAEVSQPLLAQLGKGWASASRFAS